MQHALDAMVRSDEVEAFEPFIENLADQALDAQSSEINLRRAAAEDAANLRLARAI